MNVVVKLSEAELTEAINNWLQKHGLVGEIVGYEFYHHEDDNYIHTSRRVQSGTPVECEVMVWLQPQVEKS